MDSLKQWIQSIRKIFITRVLTEPAKLAELGIRHTAFFALRRLGHFAPGLWPLPEGSRSRRPDNKLCIEKPFDVPGINSLFAGTGFTK